jgi:hypothetical protein
MTQIYPVRDRYGVGKPGAIGGGTFRRAQVCQVAPKTEAWVCKRFSVVGETLTYGISQVYAGRQALRN